jgi:thiamine kinase-like enzyme
MEFQHSTIETYLQQWLGRPVTLEALQQLGTESTGAAALKAFGYGQPLLIDYRDGGEQNPDEQNPDEQNPDAQNRIASEHDKLHRVVLRRVKRSGFGHERADDCMAEIWLSFNTFNRMQHHVAALDLAGVTADNRLTSLGPLQELLLVTAYAPGQPYAEDLLRIRNGGVCTAQDLRRAQVLATHLADLHRVKHDDPLLWRRRLRDLVGDGEGIMGLTDSYPADFPLATPADLQKIETAANEWRWRLKPLVHRLSQVHGDFHPFNILFAEGEDFHLLDRSRGEWGEPADDVSCLAINYLFFSLQRYGELAGPFADLYTAFWEAYLAQQRDAELFSVIQPWFVWRILVLASPQWYPKLEMTARRKLFNFARRIVAEERFEWQQINSYLAD